MTEKSQITVYGKTYNIKTELGSIKPQELADYVNDKMHELSGGGAKPNAVDLAILTALNIAGELFELKETFNRQNADNQTDKNEVDQKARHLVQMVEKELKQIHSSRAAVS